MTTGGYKSLHKDKQTALDSHPYKPCSQTPSTFIIKNKVRNWDVTQSCWWQSSHCVLLQWLESSIAISNVFSFQWWPEMFATKLSNQYLGYVFKVKSWKVHNNTTKLCLIVSSRSKLRWKGKNWQIKMEYSTWVLVYCIFFSSICCNSLFLTTH